jgi:hypothetical protein
VAVIVDNAFGQVASPQCIVESFGNTLRLSPPLTHESRYLRVLYVVGTKYLANTPSRRASQMRTQSHEQLVRGPNLVQLVFIKNTDPFGVNEENFQVAAISGVHDYFVDVIITEAIADDNQSYMTDR